MCRLLGVRSNQPVNLAYWMRRSSHPFVEMSSVHAHGWGIGWYTGGKARLVKEPVPAHTSEKFIETVQQTNSDLYVCHIRKATCGVYSACNSHPFLSAPYLFAHNGTIDADYFGSRLTEADREGLEGETDSEIYFRWILQHLKQTGEAGLKSAVQQIRERKFTALNFVMSDGDNLYAYWEQSEDAKPPNPEYYHLYTTVRRFVPGPVTQFEVGRGSLPASSDAEPRSGWAVLVSSEPLDDGAWETLPERTLLTVTQGLSRRLLEL